MAVMMHLTMEITSVSGCNLVILTFLTTGKGFTGQKNSNLENPQNVEMGL